MLHLKMSSLQFLGLPGKRNFLRHGRLPVLYLSRAICSSPPEISASKTSRLPKTPSEKLGSYPQRYSAALSAVLADKVHRLLRCVPREAILWPDSIYIWHLVPDATELMFHVIDWNSSKQSKISFAAIGADTIAADSAADSSA